MVGVRPLLFALLVTACGAQPPEPVAEPATEASEEPPAKQAPTPEPVVEAPPPEPEPEPEPEPLAVEPGSRLGAITIGMTTAELDALGLDRETVDPRSDRFGPYRVFVEDGRVTRVDAEMGDLERIALAGETFESGVHIHRLRDAAPDCIWREGGGERYRCADGGLWVHTTHTLRPDRYTLSVREVR